MSSADPTPLGFHTHAADFLQAAEAIHSKNRNRISIPLYFLLGHAIELVLKAFLLGRGVPIKELRSKKFGHDLRALLFEARRRRLGIEVKLSKFEIGVIQLLSYDYVAKRFEYRETGRYLLPGQADVLQLTRKLVAELKPYCIRLTV